MRMPARPAVALGDRRDRQLAQGEHDEDCGTGAVRTVGHEQHADPSQLGHDDSDGIPPCAPRSRRSGPRAATGWSVRAASPHSRGSVFLGAAASSHPGHAPQHSRPPRWRATGRAARSGKASGRFSRTHSRWLGSKVPVVGALREADGSAGPRQDGGHRPALGPDGHRRRVDGGRHRKGLVGCGLPLPVLRRRPRTLDARPEGPLTAAVPGKAAVPWRHEHRPRLRTARFETDTVGTPRTTGTEEAQAGSDLRRSAGPAVRGRYGPRVG